MSRNVFAIPSKTPPNPNPASADHGTNGSPAQAGRGATAHTSGTPTVGGRRSGARFEHAGVRLARPVEQAADERRRARGTRERQIRGQAEMPKDPSDHGRLLDERDEEGWRDLSRVRRNCKGGRTATL